MPKLNTYTSGFQGFPISGGRRAGAEDFGGDAAAATGELARTTSKVGDALISHQEETEQRRALVGSTEIRAKYARELDQAAQTGADTAAIKEKMEAELAKIGEDFQTTKGQASLEMHSSNVGLMFDEQANRIEVQRAAATASLEVHKYKMSASADLTRNPHLLEAYEQGADTLVATFSKLDPEKRALEVLKLKQELNMTAALAAGRLLPERTLEKLNAGEWNLTPDDRKMAISNAEHVISARRSDENFEYTKRQRQIEEVNQKEFNDFMSSVLVNPMQWSATRIANLPADGAVKQRMASVLEHLRKEFPKKDPAVANEAYRRLFLPDSDPNQIKSQSQIDNLIVKGHVDADQHKFLTAAFTNRDKPDAKLEAHFISRMGSIINPRDMLGRFMTDNGALNESKFAHDMAALKEQFIAEGRAQDVAKLHDPRTKEFQTYTAPLVNQYLPQSLSIVTPDGKVTTVPARTPPTVTNQKELDAVPPGAKFRQPNDPPGSFRTKPGKVKPSGSRQEAAGKIRSADDTSIDVDQYFAR